MSTDWDKVRLEVVHGAPLLVGDVDPADRFDELGGAVAEAVDRFLADPSTGTRRTRPVRAAGCEVPGPNGERCLLTGEHEEHAGFERPRLVPEPREADYPDKRAWLEARASWRPGMRAA